VCHNLTMKAFWVAVGAGDLPSAKGIAAANPGLDVNAGSNRAARDACMLGHAHVLQWLIEEMHSYWNPDASFKDSEAVLVAQERGHLPVLKYLHRAGWLAGQRTRFWLLINVCKSNVLDAVRWAWSVVGESQVVLQHAIEQCWYPNPELCQFLLTIATDDTLYKATKNRIATVCESRHCWFATMPLQCEAEFVARNLEVPVACAVHCGVLRWQRIYRVTWIAACVTCD
jgi:hypothetical protein